MKIVLVVSLLVAGSLASTLPESSGYGERGYGNVGYFYESDLTAATEFTISVRNELEFVNTRLQAFLQQEKQTLNTLDEVIQTIFPELIAVQKAQDNRLENIRRQLRTDDHSVRNLLTRLTGEEAMANLINEGLLDTAARIELLAKTDRNQNASLIAIETDLFAAKQLLQKSLTDMKNTGEEQANELAVNVLATVGYINTRHCFNTVVHVEVDEQTAAGEEKVDIAPSDLFDGGVPTAFCALQGFHSKLNLGQSHSYGAYGTHPDRHENVALTVDCNAIDGFVAVRVSDESRGQINRVTSVYVTVKTCSFGPQAAPL